MRHDASRPISPDVRIGHVHLKVSDIDRALSFLPGILGFSVTQPYGTSAAFLSAGGYPPPHRTQHVGEQG